MSTPYEGKRALARYTTTVLCNGNVVLTTSDGRSVEYQRVDANVFAVSPTGRLQPVCRYLHSAGRQLQAHSSLALEDVIRREARKCFEYGRKPGRVAKVPAYLATGCRAYRAPGRERCCARLNSTAADAHCSRWAVGNSRYCRQHGGVAMPPATNERPCPNCNKRHPNGCIDA